MASLTGLVALVTGASSGIGRSIASTLVGKGCKVVAVARRQEELLKLKNEHSQIETCVCDVVDKTSVSEAVEFTVGKFGRVDILVNNAGVMLLSMVDKCKESEWDRMVDVNVKGVLHCTSAVLPGMKAQGGGYIVNISSDADRKVFPGASVYCATKAFVTSFSEGVRAEVAKDNIRVSSISPGAVQTELASHITDQDVLDMFAKGDMDPKDFLVPGDIANAVVYALEQPKHVDVHNILLRPTVQTM